MAGIPATKEPVGLTRGRKKARRPNIDTLARRQTFDLWCHRGEHTGGFISVVFCSVYRRRSRHRCQSYKEAKYTSLTNSYIFQPIALESHGAFSANALSFLVTSGERLTVTCGDLREMSYLFQTLLAIIQRFHSFLIHEIFVSADEEPDLWPFQL